jgi:hypothetical protein
LRFDAPVHGSAADANAAALEASMAFQQVQQEGQETESSLLDLDDACLLRVLRFMEPLQWKTVAQACWVSGVLHGKP